jgi:hypothetical protein
VLDNGVVEVSEIHCYPARPEGFAEPLWPTPGSKRQVVDHLLGSPWLMRASELRVGTGQAARALAEPIELEVRDGCRAAEVVRPADTNHCRRHRRPWRRRRVLRVLDRWREVAGWWEGERGTDRFLFRVLLSGGCVADLALERPSGEWLLVGVVD